jgi:hypothetical protein
MSRGDARLGGVVDLVSRVDAVHPANKNGGQAKRDAATRATLTSFITNPCRRKPNVVDFAELTLLREADLLMSRISFRRERFLAYWPVSALLSPARPLPPPYP